MSVLLSRQTEPSVTVDVVEAVAAREGVDETALPPLAEAIDPDALDALFGSAGRSGPEGSLRVRFEYYGYTVSVDGNRSVTIE